jgi:hypothetical protein
MREEEEVRKGTKRNHSGIPIILIRSEFDFSNIDFSAGPFVVRVCPLMFDNFILGLSDEPAQLSREMVELHVA